MEISTSYSSTSFSLASRTYEGALSTFATSAPKLPPRDQLEVSEKALESSRKLERHEARKSEKLVDLIGEALSRITGRSIEGLVTTPEAGEGGALAEVAAGYRGATFAAESISFSLAGTISTKDGSELDFSLQFQYDHASFTSESAQVGAGADGLSLSYAGVAAELTSTSFSFTLSGTGDFDPAAGKGVLRLARQWGRH